MFAPNSERDQPAFSSSIEGDSTQEEFTEHMAKLLEDPAASSQVLDDLRADIRREIQSLMEGDNECLPPALRDEDIEDDEEEEVSDTPLPGML